MHVVTSIKWGALHPNTISIQRTSPPPLGRSGPRRALALFVCRSKKFGAEPRRRSRRMMMIVIDDDAGSTLVP